MNSKMMELLSEISHETAKGILSGTEDASQAALEKIHAAIASALPVDSRDGEGAVATHGEDALPTGKAQGEDALPTGKAQGENAPHGFSKFLTVADGVKLVRFRGKDETRLVARRVGTSGNPNTIFEIHVDHKEKYAEVLRDGTLMYSIQGETIGHSFVEKLSISSLHRYFKTNKQTCEKKKRKRAMKAAEKSQGGDALPTGKEVA